ncbi:MAG TPA: sulfite exporter TauE/SafE family protein [Amphiplicatus sp.]|nr:sulfite exporter TauE/SafE family protein [Caulobacterales bacterium]HOP20912.1 sulfite exporter TauE/SafE family protein [Amphiplicatus sp.]
MQVYLPIAEMPVDPFVVLAMGGAVGFLSGMFGVGGGFLITPLLIFYGIPPAIAVGTQGAQLVASSVSGLTAHLKRKTVDFEMGRFLVIGGGFGSLAGVILFGYLNARGQIDLYIALAYVIFLGIVGALMFAESARAILRDPTKRPARKRTRRGAWMAALPYAMRFRRSQLYISPIPPIVLGFLVGVLSAFMGVGGGFIMVPAMIYILHMPTNVVIGTSLFQIIFVMAITTILHAVANQTVDIVLALLLLAGGVFGAQAGAKAGVLLKAEHLRALLALIVLAVCTRLVFELALPPEEPYVVETL